MRFRLHQSRWFVGGGLFTLLAGSVAWAQVASHARIVRLSFTEGTVSIERPETPGWEEASVNTPLQEGFKLATDDSAFAEAEFENASTARIGQLSLLEFTQLALDANGARLNRLALRQGYATFNFRPEGADVYEVTAGDATVTLSGDKEVRFRADLQNEMVRIEVFKGAVDVSTPYGADHLTKDAVYELRPGPDQAVNIMYGITKDSWDEWVEDRENLSQAARRNGPPGLYTNDVTELLYGWNDLYYFGSWAYIPSYGYGWVPNVDFTWSPYTHGRWASYPRFGYTWISYEPWGWLPFHYGGWVFQPGFGWCWIPGGFKTWSPGLVTWYQGPGWVGWQPRPPRRRGGGPGGSVEISNCPQGQPCGTFVTADSFREGRPVRGHRIPMTTVERSFAVDYPDIQRLGTGPRGNPSRAASGGSSTVQAGGIAESGTTPTAEAVDNTPSRSGPRVRSGNNTREPFEAQDASRGPVVFDPAEGRFVNGHGAAPARTAKPSADTPTVAAGGGGSAGTTPSVTPGAETSSAASSQQAAPRSGDRPFVSAGRGLPVGAGERVRTDDHHAAPRSGIESNARGGSNRIQGSSNNGYWSTGNRSAGSSSSSTSSGSSNSNSSGGSRSSGPTGSFQSAPSSSGSSGGASRSSGSTSRGDRPR